jgi:hypothetical protein
MRGLFLAGVCLVSGHLFAQELPAAPAMPPPPPPPAPTADEIKRVTDYYYKGADSGPVLLEMLLCTKVVKNTEGKLSCEADIGGAASKGTSVSAFVRFFAPKGGKYEDVRIKFVHNGEMRKMDDITVVESLTGSATYKTVALTKAGTWEVQVTRGDVVLGQKTVIVQ